MRKEDHENGKENAGGRSEERYSGMSPGIASNPTRETE